MHRQQHDANFTALKAGEASSGHIVDVVALAVDDGMLATLQDAVGADRTLWHAPSAGAAVDLLIGGRCGILIVDLQVIVHSDAAALLERLQQQFPELVLLATGRREDEGRVAALISSGCVYRFLHKPVSPARASVFLATATRRHHELSGYAAPALAPVNQLSRPSQGIRLIAGAAGLIVALASALIWARRDPQLLQPTAGAPTNSIAAPSIDNALAAARAAFAAGRLSPPQTDNALDHYRSVLSVQADNATALAGIQEILGSLAAQVTVALQNRNAPAAKEALMVLQKAQPDHPQLEALRGQLLVLSRGARPKTAASASKPVQLLKSSR